MRLKYGCNPHQQYAVIEALEAGRAPIKIVNGDPSLIINLLDALNAWRLVREARDATGLVCAASFKHVSPAGAALAVPLTAELAKSYAVEGKDLTPAALSYVRACGTDPKSSFGDFAAISEVVDLPTAQFLRGVISDGIIAPGFTSEAIEVLKSKKQGFVLVEADESFVPPARERREVLGMSLVQDRNNHLITESDLKNVVCGTLTPDAIRDLLLGLVVLKYTQSNSVGYVLGARPLESQRGNNHVWTARNSREPRRMYGGWGCIPGYSRSGLRMMLSAKNVSTGRSATSKETLHSSKHLPFEMP